MSAIVPALFRHCSGYTEQPKRLIQQGKTGLFRVFRQNAGAHAYATRNASRPRLACAIIFFLACVSVYLPGTPGTPGTVFDFISVFLFRVPGTDPEQKGLIA
jgi:hypothetical protein